MWLVCSLKIHTQWLRKDTHLSPHGDKDGKCSAGRSGHDHVDCDGGGDAIVRVVGVWVGGECHLLYAHCRERVGRGEGEGTLDHKAGVNIVQ